MSQVAASTQWKDIFFTLILFIQVCCHFQLQGWNQEGREVTRNLFWKLFVLTISKFLERCLQGRFILFLLQACNVDNIDKNSFIHNFPRFCYNSKQLFWNYWKWQEYLFTRMPQNGCFYKFLWHLYHMWFNLFFHWCVSNAWNSSFKLKLITFIQTTVLIFT